MGGLIAKIIVISIVIIFAISMGQILSNYVLIGYYLSKKLMNFEFILFTSPILIGFIIATLISKAEQRQKMLQLGGASRKPKRIEPRFRDDDQ